MEIEVVINQCYGGFGLSGFAMVELIKKGSPLIMKSLIDKKQYYDMKSWSKEIDGYLSPFSSFLMKKEGKEYYSYTLDDNDEFKFRTHPDLIWLMRTYGSEKVSGECASLAIATKYIDLGIHCHDGYESLR